MPSGKPRPPYFDIDEDEEPGFFGQLNDVWAEADAQRDALIEKNGEELGHWYANIRQYGAAWWGDAWQAEARRAENHPAFDTVDDWGFWDREPLATMMVTFHIHARYEDGETKDESTTTSYPASYSIAGGKIIG